MKQSVAVIAPKGRSGRRAASFVVVSRARKYTVYGTHALSSQGPGPTLCALHKHPWLLQGMKRIPVRYVRPATNVHRWPAKKGERQPSSAPARHMLSARGASRRSARHAHAKSGEEQQCLCLSLLARSLTGGAHRLPPLQRRPPVTAHGAPCGQGEGWQAPGGTHPMPSTQALQDPRALRASIELQPLHF